jgi:hypothetical protein
MSAKLLLVVAMTIVSIGQAVANDGLMSFSTAKTDLATREKDNYLLRISGLIPGAYCLWTGRSFIEGGRINCEYQCRRQDDYYWTTWFGFNAGAICENYNG